MLAKFLFLHVYGQHRVEVHKLTEKNEVKQTCLARRPLCSVVTHCFDTFSRAFVQRLDICKITTVLQSEIFDSNEELYRGP